MLVLVGLGSADTKIKTRKTMMGQAMESTVYVKGARQRTEDAGMMGMPGTTTILQCDEKRVITINTCTKIYMVAPLGQMGEPGMTPAAAMAAADAEDTGKGAPQKGGVVTIVNASTDTGQKETMFGLQARHIKSSMAMEPSPDACQKQGMKMERDGWYVHLSPGLTCEAGPQHMAPAMGGGRARPACRDTYRLKNTGTLNPWFPLRETMTFLAEGHPFTMTTEVTELSTANLNPALFDIPAGYRQVNDYMAMMGGREAMMSGGCNQGQGIPIEVAGAPEPAPAAEPSAAPKAAAAPAPAKTSGVLRVGVVKIRDVSAQLPVENLRLNLMYEISIRHMEPIPLANDQPADVVAEARQKDCDYILYTDAAGIGDPGQPAPAMPGKMVKASSVDPNNYNARLDIELFKTAKTLPQLKTSIPGSAPVRAVDAVMNGFEHEAQAVREQIDKDLHPTKAAPAAAQSPGARRKAPVKK